MATEDLRDLLPAPGGVARRLLRIQLFDELDSKAQKIRQLGRAVLLSFVDEAARSDADEKDRYDGDEDVDRRARVLQHDAGPQHLEREADKAGNRAKKETNKLFH